MSEGLAWLMFAVFVAGVCGWFYSAIRNAAKTEALYKQAKATTESYRKREEVNREIAKLSSDAMRDSLRKWVRKD